MWIFSSISNLHFASHFDWIDVAQYVINGTAVRGSVDQTPVTFVIQAFPLMTGLKGFAESAMKASISSTVRGTHVSSSTPSAVTAMSSSMRTCDTHTHTHTHRSGKHRRLRTRRHWKATSADAEMWFKDQSRNTEYELVQLQAQYLISNHQFITTLLPFWISTKPLAMSEKCYYVSLIPQRFTHRRPCLKKQTKRSEMWDNDNHSLY